MRVAIGSRAMRARACHAHLTRVSRLRYVACRASAADLAVQLAHAEREGDAAGALELLTEVRAPTHTSPCLISGQ